MNKIYIAGSGGMLGKAFYEVFSKSNNLRCTDIDVNEEWLSFLDFRDYDSYRNDVIKFAPNFLFHLGAHTSLEYCQTNVDDCYQTNTLSVEHAVSIANELDIPLLYISTAGIFDGKIDQYDEWDIPNPLGHYARSKYLGERFVAENANKWFVCRAGWMMGGGIKKDKKFIKKLMEQLIAGNKELFVVDDKLGTPTYTLDFAANVSELIKTNHFGIYNMVCPGLTSRLEVATELISLLKLNDVKITRVPSDYFAKEFFAPRPDNERLINYKLQLRNLDLMRDWKICLEEYVNTDLRGLINE